jgi:hypothetical protein
MPTANPLFRTSAKAGTNVTANRFLKAASTGIVSRTTANTDAVVGVAVHTVETGGAATVGRAPGIEFVEAGAAITAGARVMSDADGRAITFAAGSGALAVGILENGTSADAAGDIVAVRLFDSPIAIA